MHIKFTSVSLASVMGNEGATSRSALVCPEDTPDLTVDSCPWDLFCLGLLYDILILDFSLGLPGQGMSGVQRGEVLV